MYALRNLVDVVPEVAELVVNSRVAQLVTAILGTQAFRSAQPCSTKQTA